MENDPKVAQATGRGGDRRQDDRRNKDRRAPVPPWRRPWAFVAYGVAGALVLFLLLSIGGDDDPPEPTTVATRNAPPAVDQRSLPAEDAPVADAFGTSGYERLLAQGEGALGQRVRAQLYCDRMNSVALRSGAGVVTRPSVAALADASGRVPAAECKWGETADAPDVLLLIPPEIAERFGSLPQVEQAFVRRRRLRAEVEWVGRSESLALRNVAVLRTIE